LDGNYLTGRSRKAWELTVERMCGYTDEQHRWSERDSVIIASFLAAYCNEDVAPLRVAALFDDVVYAWEAHDGVAHAKSPGESPTPSVAKSPSELPAAASVGKPPVEPPVAAAVAGPPPASARLPYRPDLPPFLRDRLEAHRLTRTSTAEHIAAKLGGYIAAIFLALQIATGHARFRLSGRFRIVHATCAAGLFLSMLPHAVIYLRKYGMPPAAWFVLGVCAFGALVAAELQGILRKRFRLPLFRVHIAMGYAAVALVVLHWVWVYVV
jgi:hypothetical protein